MLGTAAALEEGSWVALGFFPMLLLLAAAGLQALLYTLASVLGQQLAGSAQQQ